MNSLLRNFNLTKTSRIYWRNIQTSTPVAIPRKFKANNEAAYDEENETFDSETIYNSNSSDPMVQKYSTMLTNLKKSLHNDRVDCVYRTPFGHVRLDRDNSPPSVDRFDTNQSQLSNSLMTENVTDFMKYTKFTEESKKLEVTSSKINENSSDHFIDDVYFGQSLNSQIDIKSEPTDKTSSVKELYEEDLNYIDEMSFKANQFQFDESQKYSDSLVSKSDFENAEDLNAVDNLYFKSHSGDNSHPDTKTNKITFLSDFDKAISEEFDESVSENMIKPQYSLGPHTRQLEQQFKKSYEERLNAIGRPKKSSQAVSTKGIKSVVEPATPIDTVEVKDSKQQPSKGYDENSAMAYAVKLRKEERVKEITNGETKNNRDIPNYKRIISMLPRYNRLLKSEVDILLRNSIVYNEGND